MPSLPLFDDHVHSRFSWDGSDTVLALCQAAARAGLGGLAITDHFDTDPLDPGYGRYDWEALRLAAEQARTVYGGRLSILLGVEVCFQPRFARRVADFLRACPFDYVLGSVHYVEREFLDRAYFERHDPHAAWDAYFGAVEEAVASGLFDGLAHLDLPKRHSTTLLGLFDPGPHWQRIERILCLMVERGVALEINTSGWHQAPEAPYPSEAILRRYAGLGGTRVTAGSDAHQARDVGRDLARALELARGAGFTHLTRFVGREPRSIPL